MSLAHLRALKYLTNVSRERTGINPTSDKRCIGVGVKAWTARVSKPDVERTMLIDTD